MEAQAAIARGCVQPAMIAMPPPITPQEMALGVSSATNFQFKRLRSFFNSRPSAAIHPDAAAKITLMNISSLFIEMAKTARA
jgi:hypothetical protein